MQSKKAFILGVGAQKAGTSWLHVYLNEAPNADFGSIKEYHVWDALHVPQCARFRVDMSQPELSEHDRLRGLLQANEDSYFDYFCGLLERPGVEVTGDMTPSYAALSQPVLRRIGDGFQSRSVDCKAVFLMRDPVDRCLSAFRMNFAAGRRRAEHISDDVFRADAAGDQARIRTRYDRTVAELEAAFDRDSILYAIYEELFTPPVLARVSDFAGVTTRPALIDREVNVSQSTFEPHLDTRKAMAVHFREVYEFAARRFPQTQSLWSGFKYL